jgi:hypothetical protein
VLHARATPPYGYIVTGWYIDDVLSPHGASLSIVVPDTGLTLKPQVEIRQVAPLNVMVLNANPNLTDEGLWVSKLFRAQYPWKPLTANVVVRPSDAPVTLGVLKDGGDAPEEWTPKVRVLWLSRSRVTGCGGFPQARFRKHGLSDIWCRCQVSRRWRAWR